MEDLLDLVYQHLQVYKTDVLPNSECKCKTWKFVLLITQFLY